MQDIQATGLVNIQRVTSHNNPADIYTKCVTSPVLERHLRHNGLIELHIEEGEINSHILELAEQYFNVTSDEDVEYTKEQQHRMKNNDEYTQEQRLRVQQKIRKQLKQLYNKQRKKDNKKLYIESKRRDTAHQADLQHKQSQLLLLHQDRAHQAQHREAHLDHMMEEYRHDLGEDYTPFINMIDINSSERLPRPRHQPRPEQQQQQQQQQQTTLPHESGRTTADIMADILPRKQQQRLQLRTLFSSSKEMKEKEERIQRYIKKESEDTLTDIDIDISSSGTIITSIRDINCVNKKKTSTKNKHHCYNSLLPLLLRVHVHIKD